MIVFSFLSYRSSWEVVVIFLICSLWGISTFGATLYYIISGKDLRIVGHFGNTYLNFSFLQLHRAELLSRGVFSMRRNATHFLPSCSMVQEKFNSQTEIRYAKYFALTLIRSLTLFCHSLSLSLLNLFVTKIV